MVLKYGSLFLVLLLTCYSFNHFYRNKERFPSTLKLTISLLVGVSSATISFLIILTTNYNVLLAFILNLMLVILIFVLSKKLIDKGVTETLASLLGAFIGFVIGYMTFTSSKTIVIVDILFIIFIYVLLFIVDRQLISNSKQKNKNKKKHGKSLNSTVILTSILVIFVILYGVNMNKVKVGVIGQPQKQAAKQDDQNDLQYATIHVTPSGFSPKNTIFKPATMTKIIVDVNPDVGGNARLASTDLGINIPLKTGKNILLLNNPLKGEYAISLEPSKSVGKLLVK